MNPPQLPMISFPGRIHLVTTDQQLEELAPALSSITEFGFDTETRPSFVKGQVYKVALLQLANENEAYLFRLHGLKKFSILKDIFENPQVLKVGVAIRDDLKQLQKIANFTQKNFIELQDVAKAHGLKNFGLKGMTAEVLNAGLSKGPKLTNWESSTLTPQQLMYAATDAWIGLHLYRTLSLRPIPEKPSQP